MWKPVMKIPTAPPPLPLPPHTTPPPSWAAQSRARLPRHAKVRVSMCCVYMCCYIVVYVRVCVRMWLFRGTENCANHPHGQPRVVLTCCIISRCVLECGVCVCVCTYVIC